MKWVSSRRYDKEAFFEDIGTIITYNTDLDLLIKRLSRAISNAIGSTRTTFVIGDDSDVEVCGKNSCKLMSRSDIQLLMKWIISHKKLREAVRSKNIDDMYLKKMLVADGISLILPLAIKRNLIGFLIMGDPDDGRYSARDLRILESVSGEIAISINNARSLREIQALNDELTRRVDDAVRELRASNRQLKKLDDAKNDFISMASHQLRTPLTSIKGYLDMLLQGDFGELSKAQKNVLAEAFSSSERMVQLINDFLSVSRLQTGKFVINRQATRLENLVKEEIALLEVVARQRNIKLVVGLAKDLPLLHIDTEKIRQVIMNIIDNAIYYSKEGTTVDIDLTEDGDNVVFSVMDTGIGVPESEQADLFSKFFRATNARKRRPDGTGVGLFLARKVILAHEGKIIFESKEGVGSKFGFIIPKDQPKD